jgi:hypothetical protein
MQLCVKDHQMQLFIEQIVLSYVWQLHVLASVSLS